jgi:hypothetical protein
MCLTVYKHYFKNVPFLGGYLLVKQAMKSSTQFVLLTLLLSLFSMALTGSLSSSNILLGVAWSLFVSVFTLNVLGIGLMQQRYTWTYCQRVEAIIV